MTKYRRVRTVELVRSGGLAVDEEHAVPDIGLLLWRGSGSWEPMVRRVRSLSRGGTASELWQGERASPSGARGGGESTSNVQALTVAAT